MDRITTLALRSGHFILEGLYTEMLRRDTKVILPILDGWAKLLNEEREKR